MTRSLRVAVAIVATFGSGVVASLFLNQTTLAWYAALIHPEHALPAWFFFPAYLVIGTLMSASIMLVWVFHKPSPETEAWTRFYFVQLLFNVSWSMFFFGFGAIFLALIVIGILIFIVACLMIAAWEIDKRVTALMTPYLVWIVYVAFLNALMWYLN